MDRLGGARRGTVRAAGVARRVRARHDAVRFGRQARRGPSWHGLVRRGAVRQRRHGGATRDERGAVNTREEAVEARLLLQLSYCAFRDAEAELDRCPRDDREFARLRALGQRLLYRARAAGLEGESVMHAFGW